MTLLQGRRVPIIKIEFQSLCDLHDEGTFMDHCGQWHNMANKLVDIQNGGPDLFDEISEATMHHNEDKWEMGKHGNVQDKIRFFGEHK